MFRADKQLAGSLFWCILITEKTDSKRGSSEHQRGIGGVSSHQSIDRRTVVRDGVHCGGVPVQTEVGESSPVRPQCFPTLAYATSEGGVRAPHDSRAEEAIGELAARHRVNMDDEG